MNGKVDQRDILKTCPFSFKESKGKVLITCKGKMIMTIVGKKASKLMSKLSEADEFQEQLILAKVTGNFKHGNEKVGKMSLK